jgi:hypothetical protein
MAGGNMKMKNNILMTSNMQCKTVKDMVVVFWFVKCNKGIFFIFSKLIMNENENSDKVNRKVFLIIKSGLGFMGSLMHSLIKDIADIVSYN